MSQDISISFCVSSSKREVRVGFDTSQRSVLYTEVEQWYDALQEFSVALSNAYPKDHFTVEFEGTAEYQESIGYWANMRNGNDYASEYQCVSEGEQFTHPEGYVPVSEEGEYSRIAVSNGDVYNIFLVRGIDFEVFANLIKVFFPKCNVNPMP